MDRYPLEQIDPKFPEVGGVGLKAHAPWKKVLFHDIRIAELP